MKTLATAFGLLLLKISLAQNTSVQLDAAVKKLEADEQFRHAVIGFYVADGKTGKVLYEHNAQAGLAPASCQKVVTSVAMLDLMGTDFSYTTSIRYTNNIQVGVLRGNIYVQPSGDPSLGSWRWERTKAEAIQQRIIAALRDKKITAIEGDLYFLDNGWETQATPRGWIWEDIGNYYGAGARPFNWHENQYDLILQPGTRAGDTVAILRTDPFPETDSIVNELRTGPAGSGDNSILYLPEEGRIAYFRGTVPPGKPAFTVSGSLPDPEKSFARFLRQTLADAGISWSGSCRRITATDAAAEKALPLVSFSSPALDSLNYWFLKKSVNLYGEAFVKTIARKFKNYGATDTGLNFIRQYWQERGLERTALNILDGSGLSPANRLTPAALVSVLAYARKQKWYASFYNALPEINGIHMKDGYISGVRSYTGYTGNRDEVKYIFGLIVNNFSGSPAQAREKIWKILDILK